MNKKGFFVFFALFAAIMYFSYGCGTATNTTTTTTRAAGNFAISGSINSGTVRTSRALSASGLKVQAVAQAAIADYTVAAVGDTTGDIYFASAKTDSSGNFTISNLPSNESYYLEILDSTNKLVAPVAFGTSGGQAVMAVSPEGQASLNLGQVVYEAAKGGAAPTVEPTANLNTSDKVTPKTGETVVPKGAGTSGNYGKGSDTAYSGTYDSTKVDGDKDGLPNIVDADNNGDLVVDEFDGQSTREVIYTTTLPDYFVYAFTNLKIDYDRRDTFKTTYSDFTIAIGLTPNVKAGSTKTVSSVKVTEGPAWIARARDITTNQLWSATNYALDSKGSAFEKHVKGVSPESEVKAGDALKYLVTFSDGTSSECIKMINFVFTDIPRATHYSLDRGTTWTAITAVSGPIGTATTSEVYLKWNRPKDESGAEIKGGKYTFEYVIASGGANEITVIASDPGTATTLEGGYLLGSLADATFSSSQFMVGLCIRSTASDNSAENVYFTKGW